MTDELPELTDEEREAMNRCDVTEILGTWEERCIIAQGFALRMLRERDTLTARLAEAEAQLAIRVRVPTTVEVDSLHGQLIVAKRERDEAVAAARRLYSMRLATEQESAEIQARWPWLAEQAKGGRDE